MTLGLYKAKRVIIKSEPKKEKNLIFLYFERNIIIKTVDKNNSPNAVLSPEIKIKTSVNIKINRINKI